MNEHQELAIKALKFHKSGMGDLLRTAYRSCTPEEMQKLQPPEFQITRAQELAKIEAHERRIEDAIAWIKEQND